MLPLRERTEVEVQEVVLIYPNGDRDQVLLADVPRVGESIRRHSAVPNEPTLVVEHVLWMEANGGDRSPSVLVSVRSAPK